MYVYASIYDISCVCINIYLHINIYTFDIYICTYTYSYLENVTEEVLQFIAVYVATAVFIDHVKGSLHIARHFVYHMKAQDMVQWLAFHDYVKNT